MVDRTDISENYYNAWKVRRRPMKYKDVKATFDYAKMLAEPIQHFADMLEKVILDCFEVIKRTRICVSPATRVF